MLYTAIRQHRLLESIDTALCAGDIEKLSKLCCITQYTKLLKACSSNEDCSGGGLEDGTTQPIRLQQPMLPDLESDMHVEYAELIADVEKSFADDAEFPCCNCERLFQRKRVTQFTFSAAKFDADVWKALKHHI